MKKSLVNISRVLMLLYISLLCYLLFWHFNSMPEVKIICGIGTDKIVHFFMFLPFPILSFWSLDIIPGKWWKALIYTIITYSIGCLLAALSEIGQSYTMYRVCDIDDFQADAMALAVSSIFVLIMLLRHNRQCSRKQQ